MARYIVLSGIETKVKTFSSFPQGIRYALKQEGYSVEKKDF
ncbi:hypothetical protein [Aneurinibacillus tyrosinisolvens]|nr:hypothetical protein [Aneurinibacillus tyrosinisolvens]